MRQFCMLPRRGPTSGQSWLARNAIANVCFISRSWRQHHTQYHIYHGRNGALTSPLAMQCSWKDYRDLNIAIGTTGEIALDSVECPVGRHDTAGGDV